MIAIDQAIKFVMSQEKPLCKKCDGIGSIWVFGKEQKCTECDFTDLYQVNLNIKGEKHEP